MNSNTFKILHNTLTVNKFFFLSFIWAKESQEPEERKGIFVRNAILRYGKTRLTQKFHRAATEVRVGYEVGGLNI